MVLQVKLMVLRVKLMVLQVGSMVLLTKMAQMVRQRTMISLGLKFGRVRQHQPLKNAMLTSALDILFSGNGAIPA